MNRPKQASPTGQANPKNMPRPVATALPPFQPSHRPDVTRQRRQARQHLRPVAEANALRQQHRQGAFAHIDQEHQAGPLPTLRSTLVARGAAGAAVAQVDAFEPAAGEVTAGDGSQ